jgi:hypothetical protein
MAVVQQSDCLCIQYLKSTLRTVTCSQNEKLIPVLLESDFSRPSFLGQISLYQTAERINELHTNFHL